MEAGDFGDTAVINRSTITVATGDGSSIDTDEGSGYQVVEMPFPFFLFSGRKLGLSDLR